MWAANPLLPVGAGLLLFVLLGALTFAERRVVVPEEGVAPIDTRKLAPANRTAGDLKGPEPIRNSPLPAAEREVRRLSQQGDYLGALAVYRALPKGIRAAFRAEFEQKEHKLLESAAARLLFDVQRGKLEREDAVGRLERLLATPGSERLEERAALEEWLKRLE